MKLTIFFALSLSLVSSLTPNDVPTFVIDFDEHPTTRYNEIFHHFKDNIT